MKQSRLGSLTESLINVVIGYTINIAANAIFFPLFGWHVTAKQNIVLGLIYTAISISRSYVIRRYFNAWLHRHLP